MSATVDVAGPGPRADREADELEQVWSPPKGFFSALTTVESHKIGIWHAAVAFMFFLAGGLMALMMRTQLALPDNDFLNHYTYNRLFTMHGTTMMFLFAVPVMQGFATYLIPLMNGSRETIFPRLKAFAFWTYTFGGLLLYSSFFTGTIPDAGWFNYVPLSGPIYSPGRSIDFWLLGLFLVEIATILTALELLVTILRDRAPGMSLNRTPIYTWYIMVTSFMIIFGFPPLLVVSLLLEMDRILGWAFFDPARGGEPLLWQHLFWIFGHPEVYIIFLPGSGLVSTMIAAFARHPTVAHFWFVTAAVGTGIASFAVWVHHMFATGIPLSSLALFSAGSMTVAVFSGIQVFAWIATLWVGNPYIKTPMLFVLGFIFLFVLGGLTGVMFGAVPFDWQMHSTYFLIAHFHYVILGGMVFPMFGALHYYYPMVTGRMYNEVLGQITFWLMFIGFNLAFFPMHISGLMGMPRRIVVYPEGSWDLPNLLSTIGAYVLGFGILAFLLNAGWSYRRGRPALRDPWLAGGLEWAVPLPRPSHSFRSIPQITTGYPMWEEKDLVRRIEAREFYLPAPEQGQRLGIATSIVGAEATHITVAPKPTVLPFLAALMTLAATLGMLLNELLIAAGASVAMILIVFAWLWAHPHRALRGPLNAARVLGLPVGGAGAEAQGWAGLFVGLLADAAAFGSIWFMFLYLWNTGGWWPPNDFGFPEPGLPLLSLAPLVVGSVLMLVARLFPLPAVSGPLMLATALLGGAFVAAQMWILLESGLNPTEHAYSSAMFASAGFAALHVAAVSTGLLFAAAWVFGAPDHKLSVLGVRLANMAWNYVTVMSVITMLVVYVWPSLAQ